MALPVGFYPKKTYLVTEFIRGISVQEMEFLSTEGNGAKITLGQPDPNEWDLVEVFAQYSVAVSYANEKREGNPGIRLLIQPYKGGEAALFKKRI